LSRALLVQKLQLLSQQISLILSVFVACASLFIPHKHTICAA
jgi:hypothetical protein